MEEDVHLCLRCRATILGLDRYVAHRQAGCESHTEQEPKRQPETDDEVDTHTKTIQESVDSKNLPDISYQSDTHPLDHERDTQTIQDTSNGAMNNREDIASTAKYPQSDPSIKESYVDHSNQTSQHQFPSAGGDTSSLHESYTVMEDFTAALPQTPAEGPISSSHVILKHKTQEPLSLNHRQSSSQALFTGYKDPLLLHDHDTPNILRHFDSFADHNKIPHEGEAESHSEAILFKVSSSTYELESQNFESRYSAYYSIQATPHEPLLTNVTPLDQGTSKPKKPLQGNTKLPDNIENESLKDKEVTEEETHGKDVQESKEEFPASDFKFSESETSDNVQEKSELRQDDFLSSLELRSSVKITTKRRHDEEDEFDEDEDDETRPPHHHTGGKWRPGSRPPPSVGGKWRPSTPKADMEEEEEEIEEDYMDMEDESLMPPPPTYTKGKWLPGKKMTNIIKVGSTVEYHCQPCSRVLKSKEAYERHLKSYLHLINENKASGRTKTKTSKELPSISANSRPIRSKKLKAQFFLKSTIAHLKSRKIVSNDNADVKNVTRTMSRNNKSFQNVTQEEEEEEQVDEEEVVQKLSKGTAKMLCPICKLSFGETYAALHFASLAHIHNELEERKNKNQEIDPDFNKLILQNITSIVKTSPFFCESCKFYCNLHKDFLVHMNTHANDEKNDNVKIMYFCSACTDAEMMQLHDFKHHLETPHHMDNARDLVIEAQQVKVTCKTLVVCPMGDGTFRYQREYENHRRIEHGDPAFQVTNRRMLRCSQCDFKTCKKQHIREHIKSTHEDVQGSKEHYHCFICGLSFTMQREAELHRRSAEHRTTLLKKRGFSVARTCSLCYEESEDLPTLRHHMSKTHQSDTTPCHLCGVIPPLRSDLVKHQRVCKGSPPEDIEGQHKCDLCFFKNDLLAHVLSHKTVAHTQRDSDGRYVCHICKTKLQVSSVKGHMLNHSNEWPHSCHWCSRKFPKKDWLEKHLSAVHVCGAHVHSAHTSALCDTCGKIFSNRWHLYRHQLNTHTHASHSISTSSKEGHEETDSPTSAATKADCCPPSRRAQRSKGPPPRPFLCDVCGVKCLTLTSLKMHRQCHKRREENKYECPHCNYTTGHLPHLRRHLRLHTGAKPYSCPHCSFACNSQENLRKHLLKTKRHPGRFMYECRLCLLPQDPPSQELTSPDIKKELNPDSVSHQTSTDSQAICPIESKSSDTERPVTQHFEGESSSSHSLEPQYPQTQHFETSNPDDVGSCYPAAPETTFSHTTTVSLNIDLQDPPIKSTDVFCSNYATQFHVHLLEKHKNAFKTKNEITSHIRSYYHAEQDTTVTDHPLPFLHKKRNSEPQISRSSETASASHSPRLALARHRQESTAIKGEKDDPDDPGSAGNEETNEDVLTQLRRSLDIEDFECDNKTPSDTQKKETETRESETNYNEENEVSNKDETNSQEESSNTKTNTPLPECDVSEDDNHSATSSSPRKPPLSLRGPSRPAILRPTTTTTTTTTTQGDAAQPLRIMIQQLRGDTTVEVDDDGSQQVIIILPDKLGEQSEEVAALLPTIGLASSPDGCGSLSIVQKDINKQSLVAKDPAESAVIMQTDQVIALETPVMTDSTIVSSKTNPVGEQHSPVVICSQQPSHQGQHSQVIHSAQVFNPLQVVAEAAEVLTQNELVTRDAHHILTAPHQVLAHSSSNQDLLVHTTPVTTTHIIDAAMFGTTAMQHSEVTHSVEEQTVLQSEAAVLGFVDKEVQPRDQSKPDDGEIIYSFTL